MQLHLGDRLLFLTALAFGLTAMLPVVLTAAFCWAGDSIITILSAQCNQRVVSPTPGPPIEPTYPAKRDAS